MILRLILRKLKTMNNRLVALEWAGRKGIMSNKWTDSLNENVWQTGRNGFMKEYRLYQDDKNWIMEEYENEELVYAVIGTSEADCCRQMFKWQI
jgi:hypothetical protein